LAKAVPIKAKPATQCTGNKFINEAVFATEGIAFLKYYSVVPGGKLYQDLFV
jgi:citronellol/citronellal dehydrogenase